MENIFIKKICFRVRKIKKCPEGWVLSSARGNKETDENQVVFINNKHYTGKIPPFFKWPWQKLYLECEQVDGFMLSAKMNGIVLVKTSRADFPPEIKAKLEEGEKLLQAAIAYYEQMDKNIKEALEKYLPSIPVNPLFEDEIADLHICFRAYLKLHWQKGQKLPDAEQRLSLSILLCKAAQRICKRHFKFDTSSSIGLVFLPLNASLFFRPNYQVDLKKMEEQNPDAVKYLFAAYYEIDEILDALLPKVEDEALKRYLVYVVEKLGLFFASDYVQFMTEIDYNVFTGKPVESDVNAYRRCCAKVEMFYFSNFILPDKFTKKDAETFFWTHDL